MKRIDAYCDVYLYPITIIFYDYDNPEDLLLLKEIDMDKSIACVEYDGNDTVYIIINHKIASSEARFLSAITHEAFHFTLRMFNSKGMFLKSKMIDKCDITYDEPWAYFLSYLFELIYKEYEIFKKEITGSSPTQGI